MTSELRSPTPPPEVRRDIESSPCEPEIEDDPRPTTTRPDVERMLRNKSHQPGALARHIPDDRRPDTVAHRVVVACPVDPDRRAGRRRQEIHRTADHLDASGGHLMPFTLDPTIILTNNGVVNPIRQLATVNSVATDNWQGITSAGSPRRTTLIEVSDDIDLLGRRSPSTRAGVRPVLGAGRVRLRRCRPISPVRRRQRPAGTERVHAGYRHRPAVRAHHRRPPVVATTTGQTRSSGVTSTCCKLKAVAPATRRNGVWMANLNVLNLIAEFDTGPAPCTGCSPTAPSAVGASGQIRLRPPDENRRWTVIDAAASNKILAYGDFKSTGSTTGRDDRRTGPVPVQRRQPSPDRPDPAGTPGSVTVPG